MIIDPLLSVIRSKFGVAIFSSSIWSISTLISLKQLLIPIRKLFYNIPLITRQWRATHRRTWSIHSPDWAQTGLSAWSPRPPCPRRGPWGTSAPCSPAQKDCYNIRAEFEKLSSPPAQTLVRFWSFHETPSMGTWSIRHWPWQSLGGCEYIHLPKF